MSMPVVVSPEVRRCVVDGDPESSQLDRTVMFWYIYSSVDNIRIVAVRAVGEDCEIPQR